MFEGEMDGGACDAFCDENVACALIDIGDGTCQEACFTEHCAFVSKDCKQEDPPNTISDALPCFNRGVSI